MRFLSTSVLALVVAVAVVGCGSGKASSDSGADQTAASNSASRSVSGIPEYPGASTQAAGSGSNMGGTAAGKVMFTADSFDKVYGWYQHKMPANSERSHITSPIESAVFTIGETSSGQSSVTLTTQGGKTIITIANVKM